MFTADLRKLASFPPPPRMAKVKPVAANRHFMQFSVAAIFVVTALAFVGMVTLRIYTQNHGIPIQASIISKRYTRNRYSTYYITYRYAFNGLQYDDEQGIPGTDYWRVHPGDDIVVKLTVYHGHIYSLAPFSGLTTNNFYYGFYICLVGFGVFAVTCSRRIKLAQHRRLVQMGQPVPGIVTSRYDPPKDPTRYLIKFEFRPINGDLIKANMWAFVAVLPNALTGDNVTVLYDPEKPTRSLVYECCAFEVSP